ncbi:succinate-semialdehyde dehydrogenase [Armillaria mellea]|nr:succinate-semialdehyde dehydrogenase [Armillaria mellea]
MLSHSRLTAFIAIQPRTLLSIRATTSTPRHKFRMASTQASAFGLKDPSLIKTQGFVDGKWIDAKDGATISVANPATLEELGTVPEMGLSETMEAIEAASKAFPAWSRTTAKHRHDILMKLFALMQEHHDDLSRIITLENGKPLAEGKGENTYSASFIEWYAEEAVRGVRRFLPPSSNVRNIVIKQPVGELSFLPLYQSTLKPSSILTPWNFPSAMITRKLGAALAAGCTAVIKPPPETPFSALALAELCRRAGVPDGVVNMVTTEKNVITVGRELCENKAIRKISFTGSTPVAKLLYGLAASTLKKISLEAGGNAPFIVFDDANIEEAVEAAILCKFRGSGQTCVCANRIYVQSNVYAEFASRLTEKVAAFKVGNGLDEQTTHGPLIHARAAEKVARHVNDAVSLGAQVLIGGKGIPDTSFYLPTVLSDVPANAMLNSEETFGPLAALQQFETEEEVIKLANSTDVGLAGYFFSRDVGRVWRVVEKLQVGMVGANTGLISQAVIPFGGVKESGLGREGGPHGIDEYMNTKLIVFGGLGM